MLPEQESAPVKTQDEIIEEAVGKFSNAPEPEANAEQAEVKQEEPEKKPEKEPEAPAKPVKPVVRSKRDRLLLKQQEALRAQQEKPVLEQLEQLKRQLSESAQEREAKRAQAREAYEKGDIDSYLKHLAGEDVSLQKLQEAKLRQLGVNSGAKLPPEVESELSELRQFKEQLERERAQREEESARLALEREVQDVRDELVAELKASENEAFAASAEIPGFTDGVLNQILQDNSLTVEQAHDNLKQEFGAFYQALAKAAPAMGWDLPSAGENGAQPPDRAGELPARTPDQTGVTSVPNPEVRASESRLTQQGAPDVGLGITSRRELTEQQSKDEAIAAALRKFGL